MHSEEDYDYLVKVVIVGDSGVGKTNLLSRFSADKFEDNTRNTIGVDFTAVDLQIQGKKVKTQFWDTAGQEKYRSIASAYYKNSQGVILVYDISRRESFENIQNWWQELRDQGEPGIEMILVGNKADLVGERVVTVDEGRNMAREKGIFFMEVSAKTNVEDCVRRAFTTLLDQIVEKQEQRLKDSQVFDLTERVDKMRPRSDEGSGTGNNAKTGCCSAT